jgi:O-antigen/teichoic acid export membrane protein
MLSRLSNRSIFAVIASAIFGRLATAFAQVIAAFYLSPAEFGVYATGMGVLIVTGLLRGGGTGNHFLTMKLDEFRNDGGRFFRMALLFGAFGAALSIAVSTPVASSFASTKDYPESQLRNVIIVLGINVLVATAGTYPRARMGSQLRFTELSTIDVCSGAAKLLATWLLAASGWSVLALAAPLLIASLVESAWTWPRCGLVSSELRTSRGWFKPTLHELRLPLVMAILATLNSQTDTLVGSVMLPVTVIGYYFFATQIASQPASLIANSLRSILAPATASVRGDPLCERASIRDTFAMAMVFAPLVSMALPAVFESFERAVWGGKWSDSRWPIFILSGTLVYPTAVQLISAPISGLRDWKSAIRLDASRAISKIAGAGLASAIILTLMPSVGASTLILALCVGSASAIASTIEIFRVMTAAGLSRSTILYELYSTPLAALLSALASSGLAHSISSGLAVQMDSGTAAAIEFALAAGIYIILSLILLRFGYTSALERFISALPPKLQAVAKRFAAL